MTLLCFTIVWYYSTMLHYDVMSHHNDIIYNLDY